MWSGPRNLSTALMRAFGNRPECVVVDEPLYSFYLSQTGLDHPGRDEVIASMPPDWETVVATLTTGELSSGHTEQYQKHMTHHLLPQVDRARLDGLRHAFLIRDPDLVLASYSAVRHQPTMQDLGWPQQVELFEAFGGPVIDAADLLAAPEAMLRALCQALDLPFRNEMLTWAPGPRASDGIWARHWYSTVESSTGFRHSCDRPVEIPAHLKGLADNCRRYYDVLVEHKIVVGS